MSPELTIDRIKPADSMRRAPVASDAKRFWAPCLAVALVAMSLFYVTLKDLVKESEARAATLVSTATMPVYVESNKDFNLALPEAVSRPSTPATYRGTMANANFESQEAMAASEHRSKARPAFVEVNKCVMPEGDAVYSDGPCPEGASASTLKLPRARDLHASANL